MELEFLKFWTLVLMRFLLLLFLFTASLSADYFEELGTDKVYVQTEEDYRRLGFYSALGDKAAQRNFSVRVIPKTLHFIWLGPKPFSDTSVKNIQSWIRHHPDWTVKLWTDIQREIPALKVEHVSFEDFPLKRVEQLYFDCDNFGERSLLLRYAILAHEGGIYVDHDVECVQSLKEFQEKHDFFCGLERLGPSVLSSSVHPAPHLIGASKGHPILQTALQWLHREWDRLQTQYPGGEPAAVFSRVQHRSFRALGVGIEQEQGKEGRSDVVFPPHFFSKAFPVAHQYALHHHLNTWSTKISETEEKVHKLFSAIAAEMTQSFYVVVGLTLVNILVGAAMVYQAGKPRSAA